MLLPILFRWILKIKKVNFMSHCITMNILKNRLLLIAAFLFIGAGFLSSCGPDKKEKEDQAQREKQQNAVDTPAVVAVAVMKGKLSSTIAIPGELLPYQQV